MVFSLRRCFGATAKNGKVSPSPASAPKDLLHIHVRGFPAFFLKSQTTEWPTLPARESTSSIRSIHWIFQLNTISWWLMCNICLPTSSHTNSMLFSMIYSKQWIIMVSMSPSLSLSVKIYFALLIGNYLQKKNLMKLVKNVYQPPSPPNGLARWSWPTTW